MSKWGKRTLVICVSIVAVLAAVWMFNTGTFQETLYNGIRQREIYIYEKPFWKGGVTYLISHNEPEDIAERFPAEDYTHIGTYMASNVSAEIAGGIDGTFLIWDDEWFLWTLETGTKTPVSLPEDERIADVQLLGRAEPEIIGIFRKEELGKPDGAAGFFSIQQNCMITGWDFDYWHDNLIDGKIAARIGEYEEEKWYLVDAVTGEITGTLPERPKQ